MTFQYTNYKVEVKNLKYTTDDGRVFPKTAIVTLLDNNNQSVAVELFGYLETEKLYKIIDKKEDINLDHCLVKNFSLSVYRSERGLGKKEYVELKRFSGSHSFFESKFGTDFSFSEFSEGELSFEGTHFAKGDVSFNSAKFGKGNLNFELAEYDNCELTFENTDFGEGDITFHNSRFKRLSMKSCHLDHYLDLRVAKCDVMDLLDTIVRDIIDLQPYDFNIDIRLLDLTGMRLLGRINIDWQSNRVEKMIKEQNESTCRQLAEQFRMLKVNFNLTGKYSDEDHSYIKFKRYEAKADLYESLKKNPINALWHYPAKAFQWLVFDQAGLYATNPLRVSFSMVVSYLVFSFIYVVLQLFSNASITSSVGDPDHLSTIQVALYHSAITFLTIGYGDYYPSGVIRWVSGIEGFVGLFLMSYFTVAFVRKILR